jgi:hypothetical protein
MPDAGRPAWADAAGGAVLLALASFAAWGARDLPYGTIARPGAGFFPLGLSTLLSALGVAILMRGLRPALTADWRLWADAGGRRRVLLMVAALLAFVAVVDTVGYVAATSLLFMIMLRPVAGRGWPLSLGYALAIAAGSWLFFVRLLRVNLPVGLWPL